MTSTQAQFGELVQRLEGFARKQPAAYRMRVGLFAVLGYVYLFAILSGLILLILLLIWIVMASQRVHSGFIKLGIVLLVLAGAILRSLWVSFSPPTGILITRQQCPKLFNLMQELTTQLQALKFHHILLTRDFNAAVVQVPQLGILGWQQNYLIVGLPLMQALTVEQFRAVLAHELGHLSGNHSRFAGWIYRVRKTWMQLFERLHQGGAGGSWLFAPFFNWYSPFFNAYSFVLARMNEYEADQCAAELAGAKTAAEALIEVEVKARFLDERFWSNLYQMVKEQPDPPKVAYTSMLATLNQPLSIEDSRQWLEQALMRQTSNLDTHPCLSDRLKALNYPIEQVPCYTPALPGNQSAAHQLLGKELAQFAAQFDQEWQAEVSTPWRQRYAYVQESLKRLETLEHKTKTELLTIDEAWERVHLMTEIHEPSVAIQALKSFLQEFPTHAPAHYALGTLLLQQQDSSGVTHIEAAIAQNRGYALEGYQRVHDFFFNQGQTQTANQYQPQIDQAYEEMVKAQQERSIVGEEDQFKPHTFTEAEVAVIQQQLVDQVQVKEAYLVEKVVQYFPEQRFCVLGIVRKAGVVESENAAQDLVNQLIQVLHFPTDGYILILNHSSVGKLKKVIPHVERSLIFRR